MDATTLTLDLKLDYDSLTFPQKVIISIEDGVFGPLKYRQHPTDPLAVEHIRMSYAAPQQIKVYMRGTGRISIDNFPDLKFGGTHIIAGAHILLRNQKLFLENPALLDLDFPNVPDFADDFIQNIINEKVLPNLSNNLAFDLTDSLKTAQESINAPIPFDITLFETKQNYALDLNCSIDSPELTITPDHVHCEVKLTFMPSISVVS